MQVKAAIPVPAHLGRAASEFNFQPAASEPCAAYVYGGRRDKYANPSHVTGTPLRRSDNQIHPGLGPTQCAVDPLVSGSRGRRL